jgi:hypothetical protein
MTAALPPSFLPSPSSAAPAVIDSPAARSDGAALRACMKSSRSATPPPCARQIIARFLAQIPQPAKPSLPPPPRNGQPPTTLLKTQQSGAFGQPSVIPQQLAYPTVSQSYYVTAADLTAASDGNCSPLAELADSEPAGGMTILQIGAPDGAGFIYTYSGDGATISIQQAIEDVALCYLPAFFQASGHGGYSWLAVATDSDGDTSAGDQYYNGAYFYEELDTELYATNALLSQLVYYTIYVVTCAGDDMEPTFDEADSTALSWLAGFTEDQYLRLAQNIGYASIPMVDDGVSYDPTVCTNMSCFTAAGGGNNRTFSQEDYWEGFWGLLYDYGMPQVYDTGWPLYYEALDQSAADSGIPSGATYRTQAVPTWLGVLWECNTPSISITSPQEAYEGFDVGFGAGGTGQAPYFLSEIHPEGEEFTPCTA